MEERGTINFETVEIVAKRRARKNTAFIVLIMLIFLAWLVAYQSQDGINVIEILPLLFTAIIFALFTFLLYHLLKIEAIMQEEYKRSEVYAKLMLSTTEYIEVLPKKESDFISGLKKRAKFYAILKEDINYMTEKYGGVYDVEDENMKYNVHIMVKYNGENEYENYEVIKPGYFMDEYQIVEEN